MEQYKAKFNTLQKHCRPDIHMQFRDLVAFFSEHLVLNDMAVVVRVGRPVKAPQQLERLTGRHFISRVKTNGKKRNLARFCKVYNES
jgi:hypothetical protein